MPDLNRGARCIPGPGFTRAGLAHAVGLSGGRTSRWKRPAQVVAAGRRGGTDPSRARPGDPQPPPEPHLPRLPRAPSDYQPPSEPTTRSEPPGSRGFPEPHPDRAALGTRPSRREPLGVFETQTTTGRRGPAQAKVKVTAGHQQSGDLGLMPVPGSGCGASGKLCLCLLSPDSPGVQVLEKHLAQPGTVRTTVKPSCSAA